MTFLRQGWHQALAVGLSLGLTMPILAQGLSPSSPSLPVMPVPEPLPIPAAGALEGETVHVLSYALFTLYAPAGSGQARVRAQMIEARLDQLLRQYAADGLQLKVIATDDRGAVLAINGHELVTVTQYELKANGASQGSSIAKKWASSLRKVTNKGPFQDTYVTFVGLPPLITVSGVNYELSRRLTEDSGLFTTDGTRQDNQVIFWRDGDKSPLPEVYMLNHKRKFVVYNRQS